MSRLKTDAIRNTSASADALTFDTNGNTKIADSEELQFGDSADLVIKHDGSHSYIKDTGTGSLVINANDFRVNNAAQSENMITAAEDGAVKLYNDHVLRFETHNAGYYCYGSGTASSHVFRTSDDTTRGSVYANNSNAIGFLDSGGDWAYQHTNDTGHKFFVQATECADLSHNGIKFNGDTAAANGLNDYEEGTHTTALVGSGSLYSGANGLSYTKIGNVVTVSGQVRVNTGDAGDIQLTLPFSAGSNVNDDSHNFVGSLNLYSSVVHASNVAQGICTQIGAGTSHVSFMAAWNDSPWTALPTTAGGYYRFTITYLTA